MTLIALLITVAVIVGICWLIQTYMPAPWKTPLLAVVVLIAVVYLVAMLWPAAARTRVP